MNCPECNIELEIFSHSDKEIYVCPFCLSGLIPDESSIKILRHFCNEEIINRLILILFDDPLLNQTKKMLSAEKGVACPKCGSYMRHYDFDKKLRFYVNKCANCSSIWLNPIQMPLVFIACSENTADDLIFKKTIANLYEALAKERQKAMSFDELIAPFAVISGLAPAIPLSDNVLTKTKPIATRGLISICAAVFVLQIAFKEIPIYFALYADKTALGELYRLITYAFLHGGIFHLLGNIFFLRIFGRAIEDRFGWKKYLFLFILGVVVSGIFVIATVAKKDIPCVGASGAISAIIGAYLILFPRAMLRFKVLHPLTFQKIIDTEVLSFYYILSWIIMNALFAIVQSGSETMGTAYWGHIGGFIAGVIFGKIMKNQIFI